MSEIDIQRAAGVEFLSVVRWRGGIEWHPRPHSHPFCELIAVTQGTQRAVVADTEHICDAGHILFYPPDQRHEEWRYCGPVLEFYCIQFMWENPPRNIPYLVHDRHGRVLELTRWLDSESVAQYPGIDDYRHMVMRTLIGELLRLVVSPPRKLIEQVCDFVHGHLADPLTLDDLAAVCGLNKYHLVRAFRNLTGITPMEYVRLTRLEFARRLVLGTDLSLNQIAPRVGFANEYHLSRLLKKRYGQGARDLRKFPKGSEVRVGEIERLRIPAPEP